MNETVRAVRIRKLDDIKVGDMVTRWLAGTIPDDLEVISIANGRIVCAKPGQAWSYQPGEGWTFDMISGAEIDEELGWGPPPRHTGSYIVKSTAEC